MALGLSFDFFKGSKARRADEAIARTEGILSVLQLSQTDLKAAWETLQSARDRHAAGDHSDAILLAARAEALGVALDERHSRYARSVEAHRERIERMTALGMKPGDAEAALRRAEDRLAAGVWDRGVLVPDYEEARRIVDEAEREAALRVRQAEDAANAVLMASLAIEALADVAGPSDPVAFARAAVGTLMSALEGGIRRLAEGDFDQAIRISKDLEGRATRLRGDFIAANETLTATVAILAAIRAEGASTGRLTTQVSLVREVLGRGVIEPAAEMARQLMEDARAVERAFRESRHILPETEGRYQALVKQGTLSVEADRAIREARRAFRDGDYVRALDRVEDAGASITRATSERDGLAAALRESRARLAAHANHPDAEEILTRAEREFEAGRFLESSEDLALANALLREANGKA